MAFYQVDPTSGAITGAFASAQPGNPNVVDLPDTDQRVIAWRAPSRADVALERDRRLSLGFNYTFPALPGGNPDPRGTHRIGTTVADMAGWQEVSDWSLSQITTSTADTLNIVTDTGECSITAMEWQSILKAAASFRQPIWAAGFSLAFISPIPADYAADIHWPPVQ